MFQGLKTWILKPVVFIIHLYVDGFKNMSNMSKRLWLIALLKLFVLFGVLKLFFFKDLLATYKTDQDKIEHISKALTGMDN